MSPVSPISPISPTPNMKQRRFIKGVEQMQSFFRLPRNVYILLFFTLGKGFQLSIASLTLNYYVHSLGYQPDFIGLFSAMPAIGSLLGALPTGWLADHWRRKPVLAISAILSPLFLALTGILTSAPFLLLSTFLQGIVSTAYWVSNLPLLVESTSERQRVGVLALNSFLLLGVGSLGNLLGGAIPDLVSHILHVSSASTVPLRWGVFAAASFTFIFGLPLWFLHEPARIGGIKKEASDSEVPEPAFAIVDPEAASHSIGEMQEQPIVSTSRVARFPFLLFVKLLLPDLLFTMGEGSVVALMQIYFVLRFQLLPGPLGIIFTLSGLAGGVFSLTAPLFVKRWSKLRIITSVQYISAPLMISIGFLPLLPLAISAEYARSFLRTLIEPVYAAFEMEQVPARLRATLAGCYSVTWSMGYSCGPAAAGWLQTHIGLSAPFLFGAGCLTISATLMLFFFGGKPSTVIASDK